MQVIAIILKKDKKIEKIRKKYISDKNIKPHITLVYPFEVDSKKLDEHIKKVVKKIKPFKLRLTGLRKSTTGHYIYLLLDKGKDKVTELYRNLNKGVLRNFRNKDIPRYIPHLSLGEFKSKREIDKAIKEVKKENINFKTEIKSIQLLTIEKGALKRTQNYQLES